MKKIYVAISFIALLFFVGCGGGGNSGWNEENSTDAGNESVSSFMDYFPPYDDSSVALSSSTITKATTNITTTQFNELNSSLTGKGFIYSTDSNAFSKTATDSSYVAQAIPRYSDKGFYAVQFELTKNVAVTENDLDEIFGWLSGDIFSHKLDKTYTSSLDTTSYQSALKSVGFECDGADCEMCDTDTDKYYKWYYSTDSFTSTFAIHSSCSE